MYLSARTILRLVLCMDGRGKGVINVLGVPLGAHAKPSAKKRLCIKRRNIIPNASSEIIIKNTIKRNKEQFYI